MVEDTGSLSRNNPLLSFVKNLETSALLPAEKLAEIKANLRSQPRQAVVDFATALVEQQVISRWQAEQLLAGRAAFYLGKYKLIEKIGSGGFGAVYKAEQPNFGRFVALKLMKQELIQKPGALDRFLREIQAVATLQHQNIVAAYDADNVSGVYFLVMEYAVGRDIESLAEQLGKLPLGTSCEIVRQAAIGLQHAHARGIVHRDIKPANLLLAQNSDGLTLIKILDMGLARITNEMESASLTKSGQIMGTPDYMAPEQVEDTRNVDIRADIYSLGCILFRLLTGQPPFVGRTSTHRLMARLAGNAPPLRKSAPEMPEALATIVARMLARQPGERYSTPADVATALQPFADPNSLVELAATPIGADSSTPSATASYSSISAEISTDSIQSGIELRAEADRALFEFDSLLQNIAEGSSETRTEWTLRHPEESGGQRWKVLLLIAALLVGVGGYAWYALSATTLIVQWPTEEREGSLKVDGQWIPLDKSKLAIAGRPGVRRLQLSRPGYVAIDAEVAIDAGQTAIYAPAWKPLPETERRLRWQALEKEVVDFQNTPPDDPKAVAYWHRVLKERNDRFGTAAAFAAAPLLATLPNPMDAFQAADIPPTALWAPIADKTPLCAILGSDDTSFRFLRSVTKAAFSPDGKRFVAVADDLIRVYDTESQEVLWSKADESTGSFAIHPQGEWLAIGDYLPRLVNLDDGSEIVSLEKTDSWSYSMDCSPDGRRIAAGCGDRRVRIWDVESKGIVCTVGPLEGIPNCVRFSPDGKLLAVGARNDNQVRLYDLSGSQVLTLTGHEAQVNGIAFEKDGRLIATASSDMTARIWELPTGKQLRSLSKGFGAYSLQFSPDGKQLAVGELYSIRLWDVATGDVQSHWTAHRSVISAVAIHPDGKTVLSASADCTVALWERDTGKLLNQRDRFQRWLQCVDVTDDCRMAAGGTLDGSVLLWDIPKLEPRKLAGHDNAVWACQFNHANDWLATAGSDPNIKIWDRHTGELVQTIPNGRNIIYNLAWSPDSTQLAVSTANRFVRIYRIPSGELDFEIRCDRYVRSLAWQMQKPILAVCDGDTAAPQQYTVKIWNVLDRTESTIRSGNVGLLSPLRFSLDGEMLVVPVGTNIQRWSMDKRSLPTLAGDDDSTMNAIALNPDGKSMASFGDEYGMLKIWSLAAASPTRVFKVFPTYTRDVHLAYTADGRYLLATVGNGSCCIYRLQERSTAIKPTERN